MSAYVLKDRNLSFIASSLTNLQNVDYGDITYPLNYTGLLRPVDRIASTKEKKEVAKDFFQKLKKLNYMAVCSRYSEAMPEDFSEGFKYEKLDLSNNKVLMTLAGVIECYLYQCSEDGAIDKLLYKQMQIVEGNIYRYIAKRATGVNFDGWADVDDIAGYEDNTVSIFDL